MPLHILLLPFAAAYFLSYFFRSANAVIGPELARELGLSAGDLGLLTSTYLLAFCLAQLPLGMLLDRFGARRVRRHCSSSPPPVPRCLPWPTA